MGVGVEEEEGRRARINWICRSFLVVLGEEGGGDREKGNESCFSMWLASAECVTVQRGLD